MAKEGIVHQVSKGAESKTGKKIKNNQNLIKKFIKMIYFLAKKKWAVKNNSESITTFITIEYLTNLGVDDIFQHLNGHVHKYETFLAILWTIELLLHFNQLFSSNSQSGD